jgi:2-polyprenyl-6-methoxyphenol hydroxylase-like FAD-dependent oxidoreductase
MQIRTPQWLGHRAVVLGASIAGLLAARVLSERYAEVVLLERDELPQRALPRKGTPQAVHPHGLLARGRQVIESLFPGFTASLVAQGGLLGDLQREVAFDANARRFAAGDCGHPGLAVSRLAIEAELRRRVVALPNVRALTRVDVVAPVLDREQVVGVRYLARAGGGSTDGGQTLRADLTVDCTGRGSRSPGWLASWGYDPAPEERVEIGLAYVSAYFRRDGRHAKSADGIDLAALICTATNAQPRPGVLIAQEPGDDGVPRWVVGVGGYAGDHAPCSAAGLLERAQQIASPELVALARDGTMLGEPMRYAFPHSQRRRYERLRRFPAGYLVLGDALTSFNPVYGQGMTVAACEALALRDALGTGTQQLARRFFAAAAKIIDTPWQLAVGGDLALDRVAGARPLAVRVVNAYIARLYRVAPHDERVARAFLEVVHMMRPPASLFAPRIAWRVLRGARAEPAAPGSMPARTAAWGGRA